MNTKHFFGVLSAILLFIILPTAVLSQTESNSHGYNIVRTKTMAKTAKFGPGGTISLVGPPVGSISVTGWAKNEISVEAEIVVYADNEEDASRLAAVTGFWTDESVVFFRISSTGPHDKKYLKKADKKFPKRLKSNRFEINYKINVPNFSDLQIDGGKGALELQNVEGTFRVNYLESDALLSLIGGNVSVIIGTGSMDVTIATRSWRGRNADIQLATGDINLRLPNKLNADLVAKILRTGTISNVYGNLEPKGRTEFTDNFMSAVVGNGGAQLAFAVGDGNLNILKSEKPPQ